MFVHTRFLLGISRAGSVVADFQINVIHRGNASTSMANVLTQYVRTAAIDGLFLPERVDTNSIGVAPAVSK